MTTQSDFPSYTARTTEYGGTKVHYLEGGSGAPLLMMHGAGPGTSAPGNFRLVLEPLAERHHVHAMDDLVPLLVDLPLDTEPRHLQQGFGGIRGGCVVIHLSVRPFDGGTSRR